MIEKLRYITYTLLAALLMLGCSEESHTIAPEGEEYAISMTASSAEMDASRAIVDSDEALQGTDLGVYGYKLFNDTKTLLFENERVYYKSGWKYDNTRYWDKAATEYRFVAYSPYSTSNISYENHTLTISNIPYWQEIDADVDDYLVANSSGSAERYLSSNSKSVDFNFSHILSQLVINVVKDGNLENTEYKVKKIEYINVPASEGNATYTYSSSTASFSEISITSSSSNPSSVSMLEGEKEVTLVNANDIISLPHLVVPFALTGDKHVQVKVTYTVAGTERNKTVDTGITQLEAGKRYELTLTFKGAKIEPSLEIKNWEDVENVEEDPKYNW